MGVTTTMSRVIIQEIAKPQYRSRLMSVFTLALMSSVPIGSMVLGFVIGQFGELNALIPGMVVSVLIFLLAFTAHLFGSTRALSHKSLEPQHPASLGRQQSLCST